MSMQHFLSGSGEHRFLHFIEVPGQDPLLRTEKKEEKNATEEKKTEQKEEKESPDALLVDAKNRVKERQEKAERMRMEFDDKNKETDDKAKRLAHIDTDMNAAKDATVVGMLGPDAHTKPEASKPNVEAVASVEVKAEAKAETGKNDVERKAAVETENPEIQGGKAASGNQIA